MEKIFLYVFLWFCVVYTVYKLLEFFAKKILGGRTIQEKVEEKRLRKRHTVDSVPSVIDPPIL